MSSAILQLLQGLQAGAGVAGLAGLVEDVAELAALGLVHRQVGALQQHRRAGAVRRRQGDPDAGVDVLRHPLEHEHLPQRGVHLTGDPAGSGPVGAGQQHPELVAAHPGQHPAAAQRLGQPGPYQAQQLVADRVPETVVDLLEPVQVDQQQREPPLGSRAIGDVERDGPVGHLVELLQERPAVPEAGEVVGAGLRAGLGQVANLPERQGGAGQREHDRGSGKPDDEGVRGAVSQAAGHEQHH